MDSNVKALPERNQINSQFKWRLEDIYENEELWEQDMELVKSSFPKIKAFDGKISTDSNALLECLKYKDTIRIIASKLYKYAHMRRDEDNSNPKYQELAYKADSLLTKLDTTESFILPQITTINENDLNNFLQTTPELTLYKQYLEDALRCKKHTLSDNEERITAMYSDVIDSSQNIFSMFNNADIKFPNIKTAKGDFVELTKGNYYNFMQSPDRTVRKAAFEALYSTYSKIENTLSAMLISSIKGNSVTAKIRKYDSSLDAALDSDNIGISVYDNLIDTVNKNLGLVHKYLDIRKEILGVDKLHMYDIAVPLVDSPDESIKYEEALEQVKCGLSVLGEQYGDFLKQGFESSWIDICENKGKTSGAYSWGVYSTHPFVLLNYQENLNDVLTIAHEMGHAMHSFYTNRTQPHIYSNYTIFVAEVASTVNEILVMNHLLNTTSNKRQKAYLLNHFIEGFRSTIFRQTMFAEFEKITHSEVDNGNVLTLNHLKKIYFDLNKKYFGENIVIDSQIELEWCRIPHFYNDFYVYQYATGFSSAVALTNQILSGDPKAVDRYIQFLSSGCSDYPLEILKRAGVDLSTPQPIQDALTIFGDLVNQFSALIKEEVKL